MRILFSARILEISAQIWCQILADPQCCGTARISRGSLSRSLRICLDITDPYGSVWSQIRMVPTQGFAKDPHGSAKPQISAVPTQGSPRIRKTSDNCDPDTQIFRRSARICKASDQYGSYLRIYPGSALIRCLHQFRLCFGKCS